MCDYKVERLLFPLGKVEYICPWKLRIQMQEDGKKYCIFHSSIEDKNAEAFFRGFKRLYLQRKHDFTGFIFPEDFSFVRLRNETAINIFENAIFYDAEFRNSVSFEGAIFSGDNGVDFSRAKFIGREGVTFQDSKFTDGMANFGSTKFMKGSTVFSGAEFSGKGGAFFIWADFSGKRGTYFRTTKFRKGWIAFRKAIFNSEGGADFSYAEFSTDDSTDFSVAKFFRGETSFAQAKFTGGKTIFDETVFAGDGWIDFSGTTFSGEGDTSFIGRLFYNETKADFRKAIFANPSKIFFENVDLNRVRFLKTNINGIHLKNVYFNGRKYGSVSYRGRMKLFDELFQEAGFIHRKIQRSILQARLFFLVMKLHGAEEEGRPRISKDPTIIFFILLRLMILKTVRDERLSQYVHRVLNIDESMKNRMLRATRGDISLVKDLLDRIEQLDRRTTHYLLDNRNSTNIPTIKEKNHEDVYYLYNQLIENYEEDNRYHEAGDFFVGKMEMRRRGDFEQRMIRVILYPYKWISLYGERPWRAFGWLLGSILIFGLLNLTIGIDPVETSSTLSTIKREVFSTGVLSDSGFWRDYLQAIYTALQPISLGKIEAAYTVKDTLWGPLLRIGETVTGALLISLFVLAMNRKFRRTHD